MIIIWVLIAIPALLLLLARTGVRVITRFERGVVLRFGQLRDATREPGITLITPIADRRGNRARVAGHGRRRSARDQARPDGMSVFRSAGLLAAHRRPDATRGEREDDDE